MSRKAIQYGKSVKIPEAFHSLAAMLACISEKHPDKGLTYVDGSGNEDFVAYPELVDSALKKLDAFHQAGLKSGDTLILVIDNSKEFYKAYWACIFGGIIAAPVSQPSSWEEGADGLQKLSKVWEVLQKPYILVEDKYRKHCELLKNTDQYSELCFLVTQEVISENRASENRMELDEIVFLQFSSGSTGLPKGVQLTNRNILTNIIALSERMMVTEKDVSFTWVPHTHDMGMFVQHLTPILKGSNIMIFSPYVFVRSPYLFLKKISEHRGSWFTSTNFGYDWMVRNVPDEKLATLDLSSIRLTLNGAEPISVSVTNSFIEKFSKCGYKDSMMLPSYGMAEATVGVSIPTVGSLPKIVRASRKGVISERVIHSVCKNDEDKVEFYKEGSAIDGVNIRIADDYGTVLEENQIGEVQIQGSSVTTGYYNNPEVTKQLFCDGWLKTGDLGFMEDGELIITGRKKDIIFVRGQNYYAHDLEEIIYKHKLIPRGNVVFVGCFNSRTQKEELLVFMKDRFKADVFLPLREQVINQIYESLGLDISHVIPVRNIPKTTSGKVQRFALRDEYENGAFIEILREIESYNQDSSEQNLQSELKKDDLKQYLHKCWADILNISQSKFTIDDPFRTLGGNSIKMYQFLGKIELYIDREIGVEIFVKCKTIREISDYIAMLPIEGDEESKSDMSASTERYSDSIAITGMAFKLPGAADQKSFWDNLYQKKDCISRVSQRRRELSGEEDWSDWMGELENIDHFDYEFFDISLEEAIFMDPQQRLILETSNEALEDAGVITDDDGEKKVGVYAGVDSNSYYQFLIDYIRKNGVDSIHPNTMVRNLLNIVAASVSHQFNFTGPAMAVDTACSSFLVGTHHAVQALREQSITGAVVAGADILANKTVHLLAGKAGILSTTNQSKVFDKHADGSILGEGVIVIYLERLEDAVKGNKHIYGLIRGSAINNDGYSLGIMAPNPKGQYQVLEEAYRSAGMEPEEVTYLEAHGTGTTIGDPIEMNALSKLFKASGKKVAKNSIGIGSVKTNIGHLLPAAGGAALAKVLLCLEHKTLAPSLHMEEINPALEIEKTPFRVVTEVEKWVTEEGKTRKAGITSLGLGGTNAHLIIEEWENQKLERTKEPLQLLTISARTEKALNIIAAKTEAFLLQSSQEEAADLCFTRNRYRRHYDYRRVYMIHTEERSIKKLVVTAITKSKKIGICIGDIKNFNYKTIDMKMEQSAVFQRFYLEITKSLEDNLLQGVTKDELVPFIYGYALLGDLREKGVSFTEVTGIKSGKILADYWNQKITIRDALFQYVKDAEQMGEDKESLIHLYDVRTKKQFTDFGDRTKQSYLAFILTIMAELYVNGAKINWESHHPDGSGRIITLPAYPFEENSVWIHSLKGE